MKFIIKDAAGQECGPYELKEIEQFILEGRIGGATMIRTVLLAKWNRIDQIDQLAEALTEARTRAAAQPETMSSKLGSFIYGGDKKPEEPPDEKDTTFRNRPIPMPGGGIIRLCSALTDGVLLAILAGILALAGVSELYLSSSRSTRQEEPAAVEEVKGKGKAEAAVAKDGAAAEKAADKDAEAAAKEKPGTEAPGEPAKVRIDNLTATDLPSNNDDMTKGYMFGSVWEIPAQGMRLICISGKQGNARWVPAARIAHLLRRSFIIFVFGYLLYFGIGLGFFAQTAGMWFWGLFVAKKDGGGEVYLLRAFVFSFFMLFFGILTPLLALLPGHWALHDLLAGVRVFRTVPRSRY